MNMIEATEAMIFRLKEFVLPMGFEKYTTSMDILNGASIGEHVRHIIDFYQCILLGQEEGCICYDNRKRDLSISSDPLYANGKLDDILEQVYALNPLQPIRLEQSFSEEAIATPIAFNTTIGRELMYAYDHSVHHMAIIAIGVREVYPGMQVKASFGVAPSTIRNKA